MCALIADVAQGREATVAVAANFAAVVRELAPAFARHTGHRLKLSTGSTGKLYAQIANGAPFDLFLAADRARPLRAETAGLAVPGSRFTYALGRLVLWSREPARFEDGLRWLQQGAFRRLAIANPATAPYGRAAEQALRHYGLWSAVRSRLVRGDSVAQTFQFVATGNADAGFVALAQVRAWQGATGSRWMVPEAAHAPIEQQAVLLRRGANNPAARAFIAFLRGHEARRRIAAAGYGLPGVEGDS